ADRAALRAVLGPSAAALVPPAGDADRVAAGDAGAALGATGLAPAPAPPRRALPLADRLVAAGGAVLLDPERQARRLHPAGVAARLPGTGAAAAGDRAQGGGAAAGARLHPGAGGAAARGGREHAARRTALRAEAGAGPRHRARAAAGGGVDARRNGQLGPGLRAVVRAPARGGRRGRVA